MTLGVGFLGGLFSFPLRSVKQTDQLAPDCPFADFLPNSTQISEQDQFADFLHNTSRFYRILINSQLNKLADNFKRALRFEEKNCRHIFNNIFL